MYNKVLYTGSYYKTVNPVQRMTRLISGLSRSDLVLCLFISLVLYLLPGQTNARAFDFIVAKDGTGNFTTIQEAVNAVPDFRKNRTFIYRKKGIYKEKPVVATCKINVTIEGESRNTTIITFDDYVQKKNLFGLEMGITGTNLTRKVPLSLRKMATREQDPKGNVPDGAIISPLRRQPGTPRRISWGNGLLK